MRGKFTGDTVTAEFANDVCAEPRHGTGQRCSRRGPGSDRLAVRLYLGAAALCSVQLCFRRCISLG